MSNAYTLNEIAMMFEILQKSGKLDEMDKKFPDLKFELGDRHVQLALGRELWSALEAVKEKEPTYYQSVIDMHKTQDRAVPCPCRPQIA